MGRGLRGQEGPGWSGGPGQAAFSWSPSSHGVVTSDSPCPLSAFCLPDLPIFSHREEETLKFTASS